MDWTYDKTGNRLSETRDGMASTYSYEPGTSRLLTVTGGTAHVLAYDDLGNATRYDDLCLDYDAAGRLVALRRLVDPTGCGADRTGACSTCATSSVQENAYDQQFRRTRRVEHEDVDGNPLAEPACTLFFYDSSSRLLAEHDCSAGASVCSPFFCPAAAAERQATRTGRTGGSGVTDQRRCDRVERGDTLRRGPGRGTITGPAVRRPRARRGVGT